VVIKLLLIHVVYTIVLLARPDSVSTHVPHSWPYCVKELSDFSDGRHLSFTDRNCMATRSIFTLQLFISNLPCQLFVKQLLILRMTLCFIFFVYTGSRRNLDCFIDLTLLLIVSFEHVINRGSLPVLSFFL
jgi:hypothetical protein